MKRWLTRITICLILGVVTTMGVAFAAAKWSMGVSSPIVELSPEETATLTDSFGMSDYNLSWLSPSIIEGPAAEWRFYSPHHSGPVLMTGRFGWPVSALGYERRGEWGGTREGVWSEGMFYLLEADLMSNAAWKVDIAGVWDTTNASRPTPDTVHAKGFALDAFVYAAVWFALIFGYSSVRRPRRALRTRRGRCPMCGYDLRGSRLPSPRGIGVGGERESGCPECGWNRQASEP